MPFMCPGHKINGETIPLVGILGFQAFQPGWAREFGNMKTTETYKKAEQNPLGICDQHSHVPQRRFYHLVVVRLLVKGPREGARNHRE